MPPRPAVLQAVVFDMDGVLVDFDSGVARLEPAPDREQKPEVFPDVRAVAARLPAGLQEAVSELPGADSVRGEPGEAGEELDAQARLLPRDIGRGGGVQRVDEPVVVDEPGGDDLLLARGAGDRAGGGVVVDGGRAGAGAFARGRAAQAGPGGIADVVDQLARSLSSNKVIIAMNEK